MEGHLGGSVGWVSTFGSSHDLEVLESSSTSGSQLSGESASPTPSAISLSFSFSLSLCLFQINKENIFFFKRKSGEYHHMLGLLVASPPGPPSTGGGECTVTSISTRVRASVPGRGTLTVETPKGSKSCQWWSVLPPCYI